MHVREQLAKQLRGVYFGGNWTSVNMKDSLTGITWEQATIQAYSCNTIATLVYHTGYYISAVSKVLQGEPLNAKDQYSFDHPPITSEKDWQNLLDKTFFDAEAFAGLIEQFPENRLWNDFSDNKYGTYYRNIQGIIEHTHYHLGQIVLLKKILLQDSKK